LVLDGAGDQPLLDILADHFAGARFYNRKGGLDSHHCLQYRDFDDREAEPAVDRAGTRGSSPAQRNGLGFRSQSLPPDGVWAWHGSRRAAED
jgi:hypothetical protein